MATESAAAMRDLQTAGQHFQSGQFGDAEALCRRVLLAYPRQPDALHLMGLIAWRRGDHRQAIQAITQALEKTPQAPHLQNSLGVVLKDAGRKDDAAKAFELALRSKPDYPEALTNLGNVRRELGQLAQSEAAHRRAIQIAPKYAEAQANLAMTLLLQKRAEEGIAAAQAAVALQPRRADFHDTLGSMLADAERLPLAVQCFGRATELAPGNAEFRANLGLALHRLGRFEEALAALREADGLKPQDARICLSLGATLVELDRAAEALDFCRRARDLDPALPEAHNNLGLALRASGRLDEAVAAYEKAIALNPGYAEAHSNLGAALSAQRRFDEAFAAYDRTIALDAGNADAHWNKGLLHLLLGQFDSGWAEYDFGWRVKTGRGRARHAQYPAWDGADIRGKSLLVWSEQGVGDQIMFAALLPDLRQRGIRCIVEADARLEPLFRRSFADVTFVAHADDAEAQLRGLAIDCQASFGSLCKWLRPTLASFQARPGFLHADPAQVTSLRHRYRERFAGRPAVGISWRGGRGQAGRDRSIALEHWRPILSASNVGFVSLQYGDCEKDLGAVRDAIGVEIFSDRTVDPLKDLDAFAAQTAAMDLVVSIDNSTVHMAGALNVPVWILLPAVPEWRWLLNRSDSVWYQSVRLFRQDEPGAWGPAVDAVARELPTVTVRP
ncbi:MAG TPA: tetratricopeptide repeat protein [Dongiaceae bacterium]